MALLFIDGCTHYGTADTPLKWQGSFSGVTIGNTNPRRSGTKHMIGSTASSLSYVLPVAKATLVVGVAFYCTVFDQTVYPFLIFSRGSTFSNVCVQIHADGSISARRGWNPGTVLQQTAPGLVYPDSWYYLEFRATPDNAGSWEVWVNGISVLWGTGDTQDGPASGVDKLEVRFPGSTTYLTDWYLDDETMHGDCRIETIMPAGAGYHSQFTPSAGLNYANVDDAGAIDGDTTYNASNTAGHRDTFILEDISERFGSEIKGVQVNLTVRKDDAGSRVITPLIRANSVDYPHLNGVIVADVYRSWRWLYGSHPDLSPWTRANVNAMEVGYKLVS